MSDIRAALDRLVEEADFYSELFSLETIAAARAALAAKPVGEGPILQWTENMPPSEGCRYDHCTAETPFGRFLISWKSWKQFDSPTVDETPWGDWYGAFNSLDAAKAACQKEMDDRIACWGRPAAPPAPEVGEVGELVAWLHGQDGGREKRAIHSRIATLLQQLSAPAPVVVPVAVSERLPGEGDCAANPRTGEGQWCWGWVQHDPTPYSGRWRMMRREWLADEAVAWLPAHAIPLPQSKEEQA